MNKLKTIIFALLLTNLGLVLSPSIFSKNYSDKMHIAKQNEMKKDHHYINTVDRQFQKTSCFLIFHLKLLANSLIFIFKSQRVCFIFLFAQKTVFCPITFHKKAHQSQSIIVFLERLFFKLIFF